MSILRSIYGFCVITVASRFHPTFYRSTPTKSEVDKQAFLQQSADKTSQSWCFSICNISVSLLIIQTSMAIAKCPEIGARFRIIAINLGENWIGRDKRRADGKHGIRRRTVDMLGWRIRFFILRALTDKRLGGLKRFFILTTLMESFIRCKHESLRVKQSSKYSHGTQTNRDREREGLMNSGVTNPVSFQSFEVSKEWNWKELARDTDERAWWNTTAIQQRDTRKDLEWANFRTCHFT